MNSQQKNDNDMLFCVVFRDTDESYP